MSYTITVNIFQRNPKPRFQILEQSVWNYGDGGTWTEGADTTSIQVLTMGRSGTSGSLRLATNTGENFIVTLGVHNYRPWGDIVTDLRMDTTAVVIHPQYYSDDYPDRVAARWAQRTYYSARNSRGRSISFYYVVEEGNRLIAHINIG